ncbi:MAG: helix-turn-helix transcriptional regulator [Dehalococcoidia bacterium]|nr:helix-turn-helix transcriptional regulator [Dehalococcoidia bacterium]
MDDRPEELTRREQDVLDLASAGLTNDEIAARLGLTHNAVRFHLKRVHAKLDTGGDRRSLSGWRRWVPGLGLGLGMGKAAVVPVVAIGGLGVALAGAAAVYFPSGGGGAAPAVTPGADGRYPNGCPASFTAQPDIPTLADYAAAFGVPYEELVALNPELPASGVLPLGANVRVPYREDSGCGELVATPTP